MSHQYRVISEERLAEYLDQILSWYVIGLRLEVQTANWNEVGKLWDKVGNDRKAMLAVMRAKPYP